VHRELPLAFTSLELAMPVYITSMVVHYLVYHAVEDLEETGPFHVTNMLDMERFQSVLKTCAKGKTNVMQSIVNNFQLLRSAMNNRLVSPVDWVVTPCTSSTAAYLKEAASMKRTDRWHSVKGQCRSRTLGRKEFDILQILWSEQNADFGALVARFKEDQQGHRRHNRRHLLVASLAEWTPRRKLDAAEEKWVSMQPNVKVSILT
jgi:hypothetical protein